MICLNVIKVLGFAIIILIMFFWKRKKKCIHFPHCRNHSITHNDGNLLPANYTEFSWFIISIITHRIFFFQKIFHGQRSNDACKLLKYCSVRDI